MAKFILTLNSHVTRPNGFQLDKGFECRINIPIVGINSSNLFGNSRCKEQLIKQLQFNGIDLPKTDILYNSKGSWDIKMI